MGQRNLLATCRTRTRWAPEVYHEYADKCGFSTSATEIICKAFACVGLSSFSEPEDASVQPVLFGEC